MPRAISKATWDQIKIARSAGASYGELAERIGITRLYSKNFADRRKAP